MLGSGRDKVYILLQYKLTSYLFDAGGEYDAALCRGTSRSFKVLSSDLDLILRKTK